MSIFNRCISLLLVLVMVVSMIPAQAAAAGYRIALEKSSELGDVLGKILEQDDDDTVPAQTVPEIVTEPEAIVETEAIPEPEIILMDTEGEYTYTVSAENTATITNYTGSDTELVIPDSLGGYPVTGIGGSAFAKKSIVSVVIPDGVTVIGNYAFDGCTSLAVIDLPDSLTTLGGKAFGSCTSLLEIRIPANVSSAGVVEYNDYGPFHASGIKKATLEEGCTEIPANLFRRAQKLEEVVMCEGITTIGSRAFDECTSLAVIDLPNSLTTLEGKAFGSCTSLLEIRIPANVSSAGVVEYNDYGPFHASGIKKAIFETGSTAIPANMFRRAQKLEEVVMCEGITTIGSHAFDECTSLAVVDLPDSLTTLEGKAFGSCTSLLEISIPAQVHTAGVSGYSDCGPFHASGIKKAIFEAGSTAIPANIFRRAQELKEVVMYEGVTTIGSHAFDECTSLAVLDLPDSLTALEGKAFGSCTSLLEISIPAQVHTAGVSGYSDCGPFHASGIRKVIMEPGSTAIPANMFRRAQELEEVVMYEGITTIGSHAFDECTSLVVADLPDSLTTLEGKAFGNCTSLLEINIPAQLDTVGVSGYSECGPFHASGIVRSMVEPGLTAIPANLYKGASELVILVIPDSVQSIGAKAFANCPNLIIHCGYNSCAMLYAIENSIPFSPSGAFEDSESLAIDRKGTTYYADLNGMSANGYVRMTVTYAIKESHTARTENKELQIMLPSHCTLDEMTLKLDGSLCTNYSYDGNRNLKIPVTENQGAVQFLVAMSGQNLYSYAALSFTEEGKQRREIIGIVNERATVLTLNAPENVGTGAFVVDGVAPATATVNILVDGVQQSTVTASKAGYWSAAVELDSLENYKDYLVTAQCVSDGATVEQSVPVEYRVGEPVLTGFVMSYNEHSVIKNCDLLNSNGIKPVVYFLPGTQFDFRVTFTNPDAVDKVYITSTRNQEKKYLEATYDEETGTFITDGYFDENNDDYVPGKMAVEYTKKYETVEVAEEYDWSIFDELTQELPDDAVTLEEATETDIVANIDLGSLDANLKNVVVKTGISIYDEATDGSLDEWLGVFESYETMAGYLIPGVDDKRYMAYFDTSDPESYLMLVKDLTDNKFFKLTLEGFLDDGIDDVYNPQESYNLIAASSYLSTINTASGLLLDQLEIDANMDALREEVMTTPYATDKARAKALDFVDALQRDQKYFSLITTVLPIVVTAVGFTVMGATMGAPAILFTAILGFYSAMAPMCWELRANMIKSPSYMAKFAIDPSGYVYDAITLERLEGVRVTAYCVLFDETEGFWEQAPADDEYGTKWDASEYNQENSLYTNADGKYAWDVPEGWWRVKCEKAGYITTWSEWLPVPPPQTEVNIGMQPNPHSFTNYVSDGNATCTVDGTKTAKCDHCDLTDTIADVGSALGHAWGDWIVIQEPTTTENGVEEHTCTRCGHAEQRSIAKLENPFNDVAPGSFFYEPVMWAIENGITSGTTPTTFGPNDKCMRAHVVTFLWRAVGSPEPTRTDNPFVDVKPTDFYYKPVLWALENGITSGMDATHFGPTSYCNRAQVVTFLYRTMGNPDVGAATNPFTDVAAGSFYEKPVLWAVENGVTAGLSATSFGPNSICNRAQIVTFLYRAFVD